MKKWLIGLALVGVAAAAVLAWYLYPSVSTISVERPSTDTAQLQPLRASPSTISLPIAVPIASFDSHINKLVPERKEGSKRIKVLISTLRWWFERTPIKIEGRGGELHLTGRVTGEARLGALKLKLNAKIAASTKPTIRSDWRVSIPDLRLSAEVTRAKLLGISVISYVQPQVDKEIGNLRKDIQEQIVNDASLKKAAQGFWRDMCGTFLMDEKSDLWVEVKPLRLRATQPVIDRTNVNLQLGLDAETRIVTDKKDMTCKFPDSLVIDPPKPGKIELVLPAHAEYSWLNELMNQRVKKEIDLEGVSVQIKNIGLRPYGDALLLEVAFSAQTGGWFGARGDGTIYIVAKPVLDKKQQTIVLSDLSLDTESSNVLVSVFGEVVEPVLLDALEENSTIDLKPQLENIRAQTDGLFGTLSTGGLDLSGQVQNIELDRIEVGRDKLRVVARMNATVSGALQTVQFGRN